MEKTVLKPCSKRCVIFSETQQRSKGVTKVIKTVFFKAFSMSKLRGTRPQNKGGLSLRQAKARGKLLDSQLARLVGDKSLLRAPPRACQETLLAMEFIRERGMYIEAAQREVGYSDWRLATSIDLVLRPVVICDARDDERIVVEVKRGCLYRRMTVPNATSKHLRPAVPVSPLCMHQTQALIGKRLLQLTDESVPLGDCWLMYVDLINGVECVTEPEFTVKWTDVSDLALQLTSGRLASGRARKQLKDK